MKALILAAFLFLGTVHADDEHLAYVLTVHSVNDDSLYITEVIDYAGGTLQNKYQCLARASQVHQNLVLAGLEDEYKIFCTIQR